MSFFKFNNNDLQEVIKLIIKDPDDAFQKYGDINTWIASNVTDMSNLFKSYDHFNLDISNWNTSNVTDMNHMFYQCPF